MSSETSTDQQQFQPWQLFTLAGLGAASGVVFLEVFLWHADRVSAILLSLVVGAAAATGFAAYRTFVPLALGDQRSGSDIIAGRTRAALEREKTLALRSIKELEFDHAMGKVSQKDFAEMEARLRARAARLMRQLDAGTASYRDEIEKELAKRIGAPPPVQATPSRVITRPCAGCGMSNDTDAKFCKACGARVEAA